MNAVNVQRVQYFLHSFPGHGKMHLTGDIRSNYWYIYLDYYDISARDVRCVCVRKPNFGSVSVFKNLNRTEVKPEISVSVAFLKTELVSYK